MALSYVSICSQEYMLNIVEKIIAHDSKTRKGSTYISINSKMDI